MPGGYASAEYTLQRIYNLLTGTGEDAAGSQEYTLQRIYDELYEIAHGGGAGSLPNHDHTGDAGDGGALTTYATDQEVIDLIASLTQPTLSGTYLISGGQVVWETGLTFRVSAAHYVIQGTEYNSAEGTVTLDAADGANPRIDVIGVNTSGAIFKITGTPAANPLRPDIDPFTQLELSFALVGIAATEPTDVANTDLYLENAGTPTEWAATDSGATIDVNSSNNPRTGTKCIELISAVNTNNFTLTAAAPISLADQVYLVLNIRNIVAWASTKSLRVEWRLSGVLVGSRVTIDNGLFGFNHSTLGVYQQVAIPISLFSVPGSALVDELVVEVRGSGAGLQLYVDDIVLQGGLTQNIYYGLTQDQADARYVIRPGVGLTQSITFIIDGGGSEIADGVAGDLEIPFNCTLSAWTLLADSSGAIKIDVWADTYANYPPTDADSITNGHEPEISASGVKAQDTDLSDWSDVTIAAGQTLRFNVDSCTTITRCTLALTATRS